MTQSGSLAAEQSRPNFLVILADDLGYADVGFTGSTEIETPVLDRLASNGVMLSNGYETHPYCGPSRAGLITGRYQARFGLEINLTNAFFDTHSGLPLSEITFAERLKRVGYRTGIIGKWHLGGSHVFHPNNRGFDYFYGFLSGGDAIKCSEEDATLTINWTGARLTLTHIPQGEGMEILASTDGSEPSPIDTKQTGKVLFARFASLPELPQGNHTTTVTISKLPDNASFCAGQLLILRDPKESN
jgi:hypothetical protein